jgi:hypothetical protein
MWHPETGPMVYTSTMSVPPKANEMPIKPAEPHPALFNTLYPKSVT